MDLDLDNLKRLADAPASTAGWSFDVAMEKFHAAANPHAVQALIDRVRELEANSEQLEESAREMYAANKELRALNVGGSKTAGDWLEAKRAILSAATRITELEAAARWIPVSERLPMESPDPMPTDEDEDNPFVPQITLYEVIAAGEPHHAFFGLWPDEEGGVEFGWAWDGLPYDGSMTGDITHWREIGLLPEVEE